jgi:2-octaprenyl-6-methoxyphenol hydroxylase
VRETAGIGVRGWHHNRYAVVATVTLERDHAGRAFERFRDPGPLAVLPLGERRATLVWTLGPADAEARLQESEARFLERLQGELGPALGRVTTAGPRAAYPLELRLAKQLTGERVALVGNAGHLLHPVAGQGFNLGMRDVGVLAEVLGEAADRGWNPGHAAVLGRYAARRRADMVRTVALTETLNRLFSNPDPVLARARDLGLRLFDRLPTAKDALIRQAAGLEALDLWQEEHRP